MNVQGTERNERERESAVIEEEGEENDCEVKLVGGVRHVTRGMSSVKKEQHDPRSKYVIKCYLLNDRLNLSSYLNLH